MPPPSSNRIKLSPAYERKRLVRPDQAAELRGESVDSLERHLGHKKIKLGDRSVAYRLEDVLQLPPET
jgi:hypothetical protein